MRPYEIAIAVRGGVDAKSRLAGRLGASEREALVEAMLGDMLAVVTAPPALRVTVVTPTPSIAALARSAGAAVLFEPAARGVNAAFEAARQETAARDPGRLFIALPGDLPCMAAADIEAVLASAATAGAVIAPSTRGGTGAVAVDAGAPFTFCFGADSFARHQDAAAQAGLAAAVIEAAGLARDVDEPLDLQFLTCGEATLRTLRRFGRRQDVA